LIPPALWVYNGKFTPKHKKGEKMTENDMAKMICYLADKVEKLEKERCKCNADKAVSPAVTYKTNYDEDEECLTCSA